MKKRMVALFMVLCLTVGLAMPISATEPDSSAQDKNYSTDFSVETDKLPDVPEIKVQTPKLTAAPKLGATITYTDVANWTQLKNAVKNSKPAIRLTANITMTDPLELKVDTIFTGKTANTKLTGATNKQILLAGDCNVSFEKMTIEKGTGSVEHGGAINSDNGNITITNVTIQNCNSNGVGGALYTGAGTITLDNVTFKNCSAKLGGGAVYMDGGVLEVTDCQFTACTVKSNTLINGGAISFGGTGKVTMNIKDTVFERCNTTCHGGAIWINDGSVNVESCKFVSCTTAGFGACVYCTNGDLTVKDTKMCACKTDTPGGGIFRTDNGTSDVDYMRAVTTAADLLSEAAAGTTEEIYVDGQIKLTSKIELTAPMTLIGLGDDAEIIGQDSFLLFSALDKNITLKNLKLSHGKGGTVNDASLPGSVVCSMGGTVTMINCVVKDNTTNNAVGGVIFSNLNAVVLEDCVFENNSAVLGGGVVFVNEGSVSAKRCLFKDNKSLLKSETNPADNANGGAVYVGAGAGLYFEDCEFINNSCMREGGAIYNNAGTTEVVNCAFAHNYAPNDGSCVGNGTGDLKVTDALVCANTCGAAEGKLFATGSTNPTSITYREYAGTQADLELQLQAGTSEIVLTKDIVLTQPLTLSADTKLVAAKAGVTLSTTAASELLKAGTHKLTISGLTLSGGKNGAITSDTGRVTLIECVAEDNTTTGKGGVVCTNGDVIISKSSFRNNHADGVASVVYSESGTITLTDVSCTSNTSVDASAFVGTVKGEYKNVVESEAELTASLAAGLPVLYVTKDITLTASQTLSQSVTIIGDGETQKTISGNGTFGLFAAGANKLTLKNLILDQGATTGNGGAILSDSDVVLEQVTMKNMKADGNGACIFTSGNVTLTDVVIMKAQTPNDIIRANTQTGEYKYVADDAEGLALAVSQRMAKIYITKSFATDTLVYTSDLTLIGDGKDITLTPTGTNTFLTTNNACALVLENLTIDGFTNSTQNGGAVSAAKAGATITAKNCVFKNNRSQTAYGGVLFTESGSITIEDCSFEGNTSALAGSCAYSVSGDINLSGLKLKNNTTDTPGLGTFVTGSGTVNGEIPHVAYTFIDLKNELAAKTPVIYIGADIVCTEELKLSADAKILPEGAGATLFGTQDNRILSTNGFTLEVENLTFKNGTAPTGTFGGAIAANQAKVVLKDTLFYQNTAANGAAVVISGADAELVLDNVTARANRILTEDGVAFLAESDAKISGTIPKATVTNEEELRIELQNKTKKIYLLNDFKLAASVTVEADVELIGDGKDGAMVSLSYASADETTGALFLCAADNVTMTFKNIRFVDGNHSKGGAIVQTGAGGAIIVDTCIFENNTAAQCGGAIYAANANVKLNNVRFTKNRAGVGAAVYAVNGNIEQTDVVCAGNICETDSDAVMFAKNGTIKGTYLRVVATESELKNEITNKTKKFGIDGKIVLTAPVVLADDVSIYGYSKDAELSGEGQSGLLAIGDYDLTLEGLKISDTSSAQNGGAITAQGGNVTAKNVVFINNKTTQNGGAIATVSGNVSLDGCEFDSNTSALDGAAVYTDSGNITLTDIIAHGNEAKQSGGKVFSSKNGTVNGNAVETVRNAVDLKKAIDANAPVIYITKSFALTDTIYPNCDTQIIGKTLKNGALSTEEEAQGAFEISGDKTFILFAPLDHAITFENLKFTGGKGGTDHNMALPGGAICSVAGDVTVTNCVFTDNESAGVGGAVFSHDGTVVIRDSLFDQNTAAAGGGAVYADLGTATLTNCTLTNNKASMADANGGAVGHASEQGGKLTLTKCLISGNSAGNFGGGVFASVVEVKIDDCEISGNFAQKGPGGALCLMAGPITIKDSKILNNTVEVGVGGALFTDLAETTIKNTLIDGNAAGEGGGALHNNVGNMTLTNCTLTHNATTGATSPGGAVYHGADGKATLRIENCTIERNRASGVAGGIYELGKLSIYDSSIAKNVAGIVGGGLMMAGGTLYAKNTVFDDNVLESTDGSGAAIFNEGNAVSIELEDCTATNNCVPALGGAIYSAGTTPVTLRHCTFTDNEAGSNGGAIGMPTGKLTMSDCYFARNKSLYAAGGAIFADGVDVTVTNTTFEFNQAYSSGGGLLTNTGTVYSQGNKYYNNRVETEGGGGYICVGGQAQLVGDVYMNNYAGGVGGGLAMIAGSMTMTEVKVNKNEAKVNAGGLYCDNAALTVKGCEFDGNRGGEIGGALMSNFGETTVTNSRFTNNTAATQAGGGIAQIYDTLTLKDCHFENNYSGDAGSAVIDVFGNSTATNCKFIKNRAKSAAAYFSTDGNIDVYNCEFTDNKAETGGAMGGSTGTVSTYDCTFRHNIANVVGGAIFVLQGKVFVGPGTLMTDNRSYDFAGAVFCTQGTIMADGATFDGNLANKTGGVFVAPSGRIEVKNSILRNNGSGVSGGVSVTGEAYDVLYENCEIYNNTALADAGVCLATVSTVTFDHCKIYDNYSGANSGVVYASTAKFLDCEVHDNNANVNAVGYITSALTAQNSVFENNVFRSGKRVFAFSSESVVRTIDEFTSQSLKEEQMGVGDGSANVESKEIGSSGLKKKGEKDPIKKKEPEKNDNLVLIIVLCAAGAVVVAGGVVAGVVIGKKKKNKLAKKD